MKEILAFFEDHLVEMPEPNIWEEKNLSLNRQLSFLDFSRQKGIVFLAHKLTEAIPKHQHDFYEMIVILDGMVENVCQNRVTYLSTGDICLMNIDSIHQLRPKGENNFILNICIRKEELEQGIFHQIYEGNHFLGDFFHQQHSPLLYFPHESKSGLAPQLHRVLQAFASGSEVGNLLVCAEMLKLFVILLTADSYSFEGKDEQMLAIMEYIKNHSSNLTLETLALQFNYSPSYLSKLIKKQTGKTFAKILMEYKLLYAKELLRATDDTIADIAQKIGYQSESHFYRLFKQHFNQTPDQFRK